MFQNRLNFPNPVSDERDFYGRKNELERLISAFQSNPRTLAVISGGRRIGKTSLQTVAVKRLLTDLKHHFVPIFIEPQGINSFSDFAGEILKGIVAHIDSDKQKKSHQHFSADSIQQLEEAISSMLSPRLNTNFLICVDEFDQIVHNTGRRDQELQTGNPELPKIMDLIFMLADMRTDLPLTLFLTITRVPEGPEKESLSPIISKSTLIELYPFDFNEFITMITGLLQETGTIPQQDIEWFYDISGGHPYFIKLLLSKYVDQLSADGKIHIRQAELESTLNKALADTNAELAIENIYKMQFTQNEKKMVLLLAAKNRPIKSVELMFVDLKIITAAKSLVKRRYLTEVNNQFDFRIKYLGYWLRQWEDFEIEMDRLDIRSFREQLLDF